MVTTGFNNAINNPLSGLLHATEALKSTGLNEEQMRHPNVADRCHRQLDKILADIDHDNITDEYVYVLISNSSYFSISIIKVIVFICSLICCFLISPQT